MRFWFFCWCTLSLFDAALASPSTDSIHQKTLDKITIYSFKLGAYTQAHHVQNLDSNAFERYRFLNLGNLLAELSDAYSRSYSVNGLNTSSFRGMSSKHTKILWNGMSLSSPTSGLVDVGLVPSFFSDEAHIAYGGEGSLWGNGTIGGIVHLKNNVLNEVKNGMQTGLHYGSFGNWTIQGGIKHQPGAFVHHSLKWFWHEADNNFKFINTSAIGHPTQRLTHAHIQQYGLLDEWRLGLSETQSVDVKLWLQNNERQIPSSMTTANDNAQQTDKSLRLLLNYNVLRHNGGLKINAAYFKENLKYTSNKDTGIYQTHTWTLDAERQFKGQHNNTLLINTTATFYTVMSNNYNHKVTQSRLSVNGVYQQQFKKWEYTTSIREEFIVNIAQSPLIFSTGIVFKPLPAVSFKGNVNMGYLFPLLDDVYWKTISNVHLQPEKSWGQEWGITLRQSYAHAYVQLNIMAFYQRIKDWILWTPITATLYEPQNILRVISQGIDGDLLFRYIAQRFTLIGEHRSNLVSTTIDKTNAINASTIGNQMMYVPHYKNRTSLEMRLQRLSLKCQHRFIGQQYADNNHNVQLRAYHLIDLSSVYRFIIYNTEHTITLMCNNITQTRYQSIAYYPMPRFHFLVSIQSRF